MKKHHALHCSQVVLALHMMALLIGQGALAQDPLPVKPGGMLEATEVNSVAETQTFTFEGVVLAPDGSPAGAAVVVTSAGGQAVTDPMGAFHLQVQVPVQCPLE